MIFDKSGFSATPFESLFDLAETLSQQNDYEEILRLVAQQAASLLQAEVALILMVNPQTQETVKTIVREGQAENWRPYRVAQDQITGWLATTNQSLLTADLKADPRFARVKFGKAPVKSVVAVLLKAEGMIIGSLVLLSNKGGGSFGEDDLAFLEKLAIIASPYLRNVQRLRHYFEPALPEDALLQKYRDVGLLGRSAPFVRLLQTIEAAARCDVRVLLEGQSGTGKELIARAIHQFSARHRQPFVAIDCGAMPPHLIESELFGHVKGAFTGAVAERKGLLDTANGGTLFMDEIANLPLDVQAKLMRFLQEGEIRPVGSNKSHRINVRIISASSSSLRKLVKANSFREDLFYRLHVYPIYVPDLAKRSDDIPLLASHFLATFAAQQQKGLHDFEEELLHFMQQRRWAGNIRELENFVERLVTLATPGTTSVTSDLLPHEFRRGFAQREQTETFEVTKTLLEHVADYEAGLIRQALAANDWNQSQTARALKVPVQTLRYKMQKLGIPLTA